jgi:BMFP domain-containing protein YqiC
VNSTGAIVAVIGAVIGGLSGAAALIRTFLERPKVRADAMTTVNAAAINTLDDIRKDASDLRQQVAALRAENRLCESRIDQLEDREDKYVRAVGYSPPTSPTCTASSRRPASCRRPNRSPRKTWRSC